MLLHPVTALQVLGHSICVFCLCYVYTGSRINLIHQYNRGQKKTRATILKQRC